ncbi:MFS transporter [Calothrix sp. 336/3]|uniref:MFS transporter n=1 Tax=Calothrix sp. 336/3 TaxID=1337936 RepID=UPI000699E101|nr:MFS transporter [Calothrix sp. 336/3]
MSRSPWYFIPTLYFVSGLPYVIINTVSPILYKKLAVDNLQITFWTSLLYLPWVIKMFWSPIVDIYSTKRQWILTTNLLLFCAFIGTAFSLRLPNFFAISLILLILSAFISATYDIANDGFYLLTLNPEQQAFFVGIRSLFYRLATIFASGFLVFFAGYLEKYIADNSLIWMIVLISSSLIMAGVFLWHLLILPKAPIDKPNENQTQNNNFIEIITLYFRQERIWAILAFILLYRLGEAMLVKIASLFLLDKSSVGGLGLSTSPIVDRAAAKGDRVANEIMNQAVDYLVTASSSVVERIFTPGIRLEIVTTGSVWQSQWGMWEKFSQGMTGKYDFVGVILPRNEPAFGAALLARNTYQSS